MHAMPLAFLAYVMIASPFLPRRMDSHVHFSVASPAVFGDISRLSSFEAFAEPSNCDSNGKFQTIRPELQGFQTSFSSSRLFSPFFAVKCPLSYHILL
jgi:hypothetical protein